ncbi:MAG: YebC/PmpR family DNA-binding transcriptional regulator [Candidatus Omnitrophota bacterium]
MSGHSKWATTKHKKAAQDAKKGRVFTKLIREITVAARHGGGNPETNPKLRLALERARQANMPSDNVDRAVKKGTGELPGVSYEEVVYEGYGPGGVAVLVEVLKDNKNRTYYEVRNLFSKKNGNLAGLGSVSWIFKSKGYFLVERSCMDEEALMNIALENGAEDLKTEGDVYEITCDTKDFEKVKKALEQNRVKLQMAEVTKLPTTFVKVDGEAAKQVLQLVESLEDHDDVQHVYANFDIPDEILQAASKEE